MKSYRTLLLGLLAAAGCAVSLFFSSAAASAATTTVQVGDLFFCSPASQGGVCETRISVGDTVSWNFAGAQNAHTVTECGANCNTATQTPLFNSGMIDNGGTFQFQFTQAGTYLYLCRVHPFDMRGRIVVTAAAPTPAGGGATPASGGSTPVTGVTPTDLGANYLPRDGYGPERQASDAWWLVGAMAAAGLTLVASGAFALARARQR